MKQAETDYLSHNASARCYRRPPHTSNWLPLYDEKSSSFFSRLSQHMTQHNVH